MDVKKWFLKFFPKTILHFKRNTNLRLCFRSLNDHSFVVAKSFKARATLPLCTVAIQIDFRFQKLPKHGL